MRLRVWHVMETIAAAYLILLSQNMQGTVTLGPMPRFTCTSWAIWGGMKFSDAVVRPHAIPEGEIILEDHDDVV
jgi:hypothetical protein